VRPFVWSLLPSSNGWLEHSRRRRLCGRLLASPHFLAAGETKKSNGRMIGAGRFQIVLAGPIDTCTVMYLGDVERWPSRVRQRGNCTVTACCAQKQ